MTSQPDRICVLGRGAGARPILGAGLAVPDPLKPSVKRCAVDESEHPELDRLADTKALSELFEIVHDSSGGDFRQYKASTISRRIDRRMRMTHVSELRDYVELLRTDPDEVVTLGNDLLISVTQFFRDPAVWDFLQANVLPALVRTAGPGGTVRAWVPGCATGEEAYSLLIALLETCRESGIHPALAVTGTDVSDRCLELARQGAYPRSIESDVSGPLLSRYFERTSIGYRVTDAQRALCEFVHRDLVTEPPLGDMDLVSLRNVLIYMDHELQDRVLNSVHRSLVSDGILVLGSAETVGMRSPWFTEIDRRQKIYRRLQGLA